MQPSVPRAARGLTLCAALGLLLGGGALSAPEPPGAEHRVLIDVVGRPVFEGFFAASPDRSRREVGGESPVTALDRWSSAVLDC